MIHKPDIKSIKMRSTGKGLGCPIEIIMYKRKKNSFLKVKTLGNKSSKSFPADSSIGAVQLFTQVLGEMEERLDKDIVNRA